MRKVFSITPQSWLSKRGAEYSSFYVYLWLSREGKWSPSCSGFNQARCFVLLAVVTWWEKNFWFYNCGQSVIPHEGTPKCQCCARMRYTKYWCHSALHFFPPSPHYYRHLTIQLYYQVTNAQGMCYGTKHTHTHIHTSHTHTHTHTRTQKKKTIEKTNKRLK